MRDSAALYASFRHHLAEIIARRPQAGQVVTPAAPPAPDPALVEFERVRAAALARIAAEERRAAQARAARQAAQAAEDAAVAMILASRAAMLGHVS